MSSETSIEWADASWNPMRGCSRVSEGCRNCYAERVAARFSGFETTASGFVERGLAFRGFAEQTKAGPRWTGRVELVPDALDWPLRVRRPAWVRKAEAEGRRPRVFVNSMSDLFHERLSDAEIAAVFGIMAAKAEWDFLVLTKRPERMREWFGLHGSDAKAAADAIYGTLVENDGWPLPEDFDTAASNAVELAGWPLPNVWLGTSVEDQATADERIPHLLATPAALRFVSYEPALGPVDFSAVPISHLGSSFWNPLQPPPPDAGGPWARLGKLDWLIWGGESGPGARPNDLAWGRSARDQCKASGVAFFAKQFGARPVRDVELKALQSGGISHEERIVTERCEAVPLRLRDPKGGDMGEWPEDLRVREFPNAVRS